MELNKILVGRMAARLLRTMLVECGLGPFLAIPSNRIDEFQRIAEKNAPEGEDGPLAIEPSTALAALFNNAEDAKKFQIRSKCSNAERTLCELIVGKRDEALEKQEDLLFFKKQILE